MHDLLIGAKEVVEILQKQGFIAYYAGGAVRDMLLGFPPKDVDIATNATPDQLAKLFSHNFTAGAQLGERFGVISILHKGHIYEIATFRTDSEESDGRRPERVDFASPEMDAQRRDFTMNALFYDPVLEKVYDYVDGQKDLHERVVRFIGDPAQRIAEDSLRLLRAVRFVHQIEGQYEPQTYYALRDYATSIKKVSWERIAAELNRMLRTKTRAIALEDLQDIGLLTHILPEVEALKGVAQPRQYHKEGSVWNHAMSAIAHLPEDASLDLIWATLLHDVGKPHTFSVEERIRFDNHASISAKIAREVLTRLRFPKKNRENILWAIEHHMSLMHLLDADVTDKTKNAWFGHQAFPLLLELHRADATGTTPPSDALYQALLAAFTTWQDEQSRLPVRLFSGEDIMEIAHLSPSPAVGELVTLAYEAQIAGEFSTYEEGKEWLKMQMTLRKGDVSTQ